MLVLSLRSVSWKFWFLGSRVAQRCTSLNAWSNLPRCSSAWHRRYKALMSAELMSMATDGRQADPQGAGLHTTLPLPLPRKDVFLRGTHLN